MTHAEKRQLAREVEEWLINMVGPVEDEDLEEVAGIIEQTVSDFLASELAERSN